jgi:hypothetical protein
MLPNNYEAQAFNTNNQTNNTNQLYNSNIKLETSELPTQDIPITTTKITADENIKVNFVPESENETYYIPQTNETLTSNTSLFSMLDDYQFDDFKMPIIVCLLYVVLQLPITQTIIKQLFSFSYDTDNKITTIGTYLFGCIFGVAYFIIDRMINKY